MATCARHQAGPVFDPPTCHIAFRSGRANGSVPQGMSHDGAAGKSCLPLSLMNPTKVRFDVLGSIVYCSTMKRLLAIKAKKVQREPTVVEFF